MTGPERPLEWGPVGEGTAERSHVGHFERDGGRLVWRHNRETLCVEPWGPDVLHVRATQNAPLRGNWRGVPTPRAGLDMSDSARLI